MCVLCSNNQAKIRKHKYIAYNTLRVIHTHANMNGVAGRRHTGRRAAGYGSRSTVAAMLVVLSTAVWVDSTVRADDYGLPTGMCYVVSEQSV